MAIAAPSSFGSDSFTDYSDTSVRWLRTNYHVYAAATSIKSFPVLLETALWKMKFAYEYVANGSWDKERWRKHLKELSKMWNRKLHLEMVAFLAAGGYKEERAPTEKVVVSSPDGREVSIILMDEMDEGAEEVLNLMPPSQLSPKHELEEIVADAALAADQRYGAW